VIEAGGGKVWSQIAKKVYPEPIVSDGRSPPANRNVSGKRLEDEPEAPRLLVVLLTVHNPDEYRVEGIFSGAVDFLSAQSELNHLKAQIKNLIESRSGLKDAFAGQEVPADTRFTLSPLDARILTKAIKVVEEHMIDEDFGVDRFSQLMGMSRSTLKRKLKPLTGQSPQPFVQQLRLKRAARLLVAGGVSVSETARMVGFYDLSHFGRVFKNHFGCTPSSYGQKVKASVPVDESAHNGGLGTGQRHHFEPNPGPFAHCV